MVAEKDSELELEDIRDVFREILGITEAKPIEVKEESEKYPLDQTSRWLNMNIEDVRAELQDFKMYPTARHLISSADSILTSKEKKIKDRWEIYYIIIGRIENQQAITLFGTSEVVEEKQKKAKKPKKGKRKKKKGKKSKPKTSPSKKPVRVESKPKKTEIGKKNSEIETILARIDKGLPPTAEQLEKLKKSLPQEKYFDILEKIEF